MLATRSESVNTSAQAQAIQTFPDTSRLLLPLHDAHAWSGARCRFPDAPGATWSTAFSLLQSTKAYVPRGGSMSNRFLLPAVKSVLAGSQHALPYVFVLLALASAGM